MSNKLSGKTLLSGALLVLTLPILTILVRYMGPRKYYVLSVIMALIALGAFFLSFENRRPQARELIIIAVMSAIAAVARTAFIWVPFFKPLAAVIIITGAALGAQAGFLCGALSCLVSNFIFGQGPWTPWQMLAFGLCGFVSGLLFYHHQERCTKKILAVYGVAVILLLTGPVLDLSGLLSRAQLPDGAAILAVLAAGLQVNLIQAAATAIFLWIAAEPMLKKLWRIKTKYGMME